MNQKVTSSQRGFTLIELLVVIAIIGVLSAVVLASLNTARSRGNDAAIKSNLSTVAVQAELYYDTNNSYATSSISTCGQGLFASDRTISQAITSADAASAGAASCYASSAGYAVSVPLSTGNGHWCIDSTGTKKSSSGPATSITCP
jgi:type IV pilus assembly protein PilA